MSVGPAIATIYTMGFAGICDLSGKAHGVE
jgi:hypothetical protein